MPTQYGGAGTGELMGLQFLQQKEAQDREFKLRQMQSYDQSRLDEQRIRAQELQNRQQEVEYKRLQEEEKSRRQEASLLSTAFKNGVNDRVRGSVLDANSALVSTYEKLGTDLSATNPKRAQEYFDKAIELKSKLPEIEKKNFDVIQSRRDERSAAFGEVSDQASWDVARGYAANLALPVPERFKNWNDPATQKWIKDQDVFSKAGRLAMKAVNDAKMANSTQQLREAQLTDTKSKTTVRDANEERNKNKVPTIKTTKQTTTEYLTEYAYLNDVSEKFSSVPTAQQGAIVNAIANQTQDYLNSGKTKSITEAREMARREVLSQISEEGVYTPKVTATETKPSTQFVNGKVYQDANGNKAKYNNGKWEPIK